MYDRLGVPARPFDRVRYFAPYKSNLTSLNTLRSNEALMHNVTPLTWGLREVLQFAEVLLNKDDVDAKADALIDFIKERLLDREFKDPQLLPGRDYRVQSFADLDEWFRDVLIALETKDGEVAHAPRRDDPQGAQPALEHLLALRGAGHRRRLGERPSVGDLRGPRGVRDRRRGRSKRTRRT